MVIDTVFFISNTLQMVYRYPQVHYEKVVIDTTVKIMPRMTDEEAQAFAEQVAKNPPKVTGNGKNGFFMKHKGNIIILDDVSAAWLRVTSESSHKTPSDLVNEMIRERMAVAM